MCAARVRNPVCFSSGTQQAASCFYGLICIVEIRLGNFLPFFGAKKREKISWEKISLFGGRKKGRNFRGKKSPFCVEEKKGENFPRKNLPFAWKKKREKISREKISLLRGRKKGRKFPEKKSPNLPGSKVYKNNSCPAQSFPQTSAHTHTRTYERACSWLLTP